MGTDWVTLLDRRTAEEIRRADAEALAVLVEAKKWPRLWDSGAESLGEFKADLIEEECLSAPLDLDYYGCMAEVFSGIPPGAIVWEDWAGLAVEEADDDDPLPTNLGRYLLQPSNTALMIASLRANLPRVRVMSKAGIDELERWYRLCVADSRWTVVYHIDC